MRRDTGSDLVITGRQRVRFAPQGLKPRVILDPFGMTKVMP
jgi:hypothetical protein